MPTPNYHRAALDSLKAQDLDSMEVSLLLVATKTKKDGSRHIHSYNIKYSQITDLLKNELKLIFRREISSRNDVFEYSFDGQELLENQVYLFDDISGTDISRISTMIDELNPEEDKIARESDVYKYNGYIIRFSQRGRTVLFGSKRAKQAWKITSKKETINIFFKELVLDSVNVEKLFRLYKTLDYIVFNSNVFVFSKLGFESALNIRDGMIRKANALYVDEEFKNLFPESDTNRLKEIVGDNLNFLRKLATVHNLGLFRDPNYVMNLEARGPEFTTGIVIENGKFVYDAESLPKILSVLSDRRLLSPQTSKLFDVTGARPVDG